MSRAITRTNFLVDLAKVRELRRFTSGLVAKSAIRG